MAPTTYSFWKHVPEEVRQVVRSTFGTTGGHRNFTHGRQIAPDACPIGVALIQLTGVIVKGSPQPKEAYDWLKEAGIKYVTQAEVSRFINDNDSGRIRNLSKALDM